MQPAGHIPSRTGPRQRLRIGAVLASLMAVAMLIAGCGGGGSGPVVTNVGTAVRSSNPSSSSYAQALAFAKCVRTHGVPLWPAPGRSGQFDKSDLTPHRLGVSSVEAATAQRTCRSLLPTYSPAQQSPLVVTEALRFSRCMRAHGSTNFPDPKSNGAIVIPHAMESSPVYVTALHLCIRKYGVPPPPEPVS
jgi:hypothetical protein